MPTSMHKRRATEQKRPIDSCRLEFAPIELADAFPIAAGGVYHQPDGPITYLHVHDCLELGYCHEGSGLFVVEDKIMPYGTGDVSVINDRELHLARSAAGSVSTWTFVSLDPARLVRSSADEQDLLETASLSGPRFANVVRPAEQAELVQAVRSLVRELDLQRPGYRSAVRGIVWTLMALLHRLPGRNAAAGEPRSLMGRVAPALEQMARYYAEPLGIDDLAERCHLSVTHFRRLFAQATGCSPLDYLTRLRVRMAGALLRSTERAVIEIALDVGYPTLSSFNRQFKALTKLTPREWRRQR